MYVIERSEVIGLPLERAFEFFSDPRNLPRITPPWLGFTVLDAPATLVAGCEMRYTIRWLRIPVSWTTAITGYEPNVRFTDEQKRGPYRMWRHEHHFAPRGDATLMTDRIEYEMPFGLIGKVVHALIVQRQLREILEYRSNAARVMFPVHAGGES